MPRSGSRVRVSFPAPVFSKAPTCSGLCRFSVARGRRVAQEAWPDRQSGSLGIHNALRSAIIHGSDAGIAQLVEHDLAKVGVASSSLVSRSSFQQSLGSPGFCFLEATCDHYGRDAPSNGQVAEWSCSGLQSRVRRFDSDLGLHCEQRLRRPWAPFSCSVSGGKVMFATRVEVANSRGHSSLPMTQVQCRTWIF